MAITHGITSPLGIYTARGEPVVPPYEDPNPDSLYRKFPVGPIVDGDDESLGRDPLDPDRPLERRPSRDQEALEG